tara:strand:+ start:78 stop:1262 length:1185 start_codon:yes stop_codon:yes gene_type:complete
MSKDIDIVIYGATGFTGQLCVKYFQSLDLDIKWAIAGRNLVKLENVASKFSTNVEILVADSDDEKALKDICSRSKVVLSTAGPFHRYGSKLVAACIENDTHYVDITGENFWVKGLIEKHHIEAARRGLRIIPSCGFDSIPSDIGTFFAVKSTNKPIKRVDSFHSWKGEASGGTIETMFAMGDLNLGKEIRDPFLLNPEGSYTSEQKELSADIFSISKNKDLNAWSGPFIMAGANTRVVRRSEALLTQRQESYGNNFVYQEHSFHKSWGKAFSSALGLGLLGLTLISPIRKIVRSLLRKPGEGPSLEVQENGWFDCKYLVESEDGQKSLYRMFGKGDPGYKVTSKFVAECALSLLEDPETLPGGSEYGGVLTSASGLGNILIDRLKNADIHFEAM